MKNILFVIGMITVMIWIIILLIVRKEISKDKYFILTDDEFWGI